MNDFDKLAQMRAAELATLGPDQIVDGAPGSWVAAGAHRCIAGHITRSPTAEPVDCETCGSIALLTFPADTGGTL